QRYLDNGRLAAPATIAAVRG
nr:capsid protein VP5 - human herpesvirus 1 (fragments) [Human alphaherpesvirus 1]